VVGDLRNLVIGILSVLCVILFVCHFASMVTDFSPAEKDSVVTFCMHVGLLSRQVFSTFGEHWLAGSHGGGGITSRMNGFGGSCVADHCFPFGIISAEIACSLGASRWACEVEGLGNIDMTVSEATRAEVP